MKNDRKFFALFLGWLLPGAGHYYLGFRWKGITLFLLIIPVFVTGIAMAGFSNINIQEPFHLGSYSFIGSITIAVLCITHYFPPNSVGNSYGYQLGCLYSSVSSLLNALILLRLYSLANDSFPEENS